MNRAINLRDSNLALVIPDGTSVTVELAPAYLCESIGTPGVDPGNKYLQDVHFQLTDAEINALPSGLPARIDEGIAVVDTIQHHNVLPLPLIHLGATELHLFTEQTETLRVKASGMVAILVGGRRKVES
ncbi:MAG: hypothetical protein AAF387_16745 [Pseudomonadota bacterium]